MIERTIVDGKPATVAYLDEKFRPVDKADAVMIKVMYDDGGVAFLEGDKAKDQADV